MCGETTSRTVAQLLPVDHYPNAIRRFEEIKAIDAIRIDQRCRPFSGKIWQKQIDATARRSRQEPDVQQPCRTRVGLHGVCGHFLWWLALIPTPRAAADFVESHQAFAVRKFEIAKSCTG
ncbi:hypothetical protein DF020_30925 [Burkholderia cenocepacia]|uniref:Uncharacterized protein n=1 Tax=Burkholderia cenocepacia TaxID=95486 RepID=A0A427P4C2_9BURK|nr:hypothetical protein DF020_30925 [Burkholderia cenocepacia]RSC14589.1 hypothetical protein EGT41_15395 [Burkholderia cenocepacia]